MPKKIVIEYESSQEKSIEGELKYPIADVFFNGNDAAAVACWFTRQLFLNGMSNEEMKDCLLTLRVVLAMLQAE